MSKIHLETLTFSELVSVGRQLQDELRNAENNLSVLKRFVPYLSDDEYDNLPLEDKKNYIKSSRDSSDELKTLQFNMEMLMNLQNKYNILKASKKVKQVEKRVKSYNEFIKLKYNW